MFRVNCFRLHETLALTCQRFAKGLYHFPYYHSEINVVTYINIIIYLYMEKQATD